MIEDIANNYSMHVLVIIKLVFYTLQSGWESLLHTFQIYGSSESYKLIISCFYLSISFKIVSSQNHNTLCGLRACSLSVGVWVFSMVTLFKGI